MHAVPRQGQVRRPSRTRTTRRPVAASCVDCHMPKFVTGVLHFLRDHSIRSPDPALTEALRFAENAPNACNQCHQRQVRDVGARGAGEAGGGRATRTCCERAGLVMRIRKDRRRAFRLDELVAEVKDNTSLTFFRMTALQAILAVSGARRSSRRCAMRRCAICSRFDHVELLQLLTTAYGAYPDDKAVGGPAPSFVDHENRPVRVLAGYGALRGGWRGGHGADRGDAPRCIGDAEADARAPEPDRGTARDHRRFTPTSVGDAVRNSTTTTTASSGIALGASRVKWRPRRRRAAAPPCAIGATERGRARAPRSNLYGAVRAAFDVRPASRCCCTSTRRIRSAEVGQHGAGGNSPGSTCSHRSKARLGRSMTLARSRGCSALRSGWSVGRSGSPSLSRDPSGGEMLRRVRWASRSTQTGRA